MSLINGHLIPEDVNCEFTLEIRGEYIIPFEISKYEWFTFLMLARGNISYFNIEEGSREKIRNLSKYLICDNAIKMCGFNNECFDTDKYSNIIHEIPKHEDFQIATDFRSIEVVERNYPIIYDCRQMYSNVTRYCSGHKFEKLNEFIQFMNSREDVNFIVAGGAVRVMLGQCINQYAELLFGDIDLFIVDTVRPPIEAITHSLSIIESWLTSCEVNYLTTRSRYTVSIYSKFFTLQLILRVYDSIPQVLESFDIDCCCVGFQNNTFYIHERAAHAIRYNVNIVRLSHYSPTFESRLLKYASRGYSIMDPGFVKSRVRFCEQTSLYGLKRILFVFQKRCSRRYTTPYGTADSAYGPLSDIRIGPYSVHDIHPSIEKKRSRVGSCLRTKIQHMVRHRTCVPFVIRINEVSSILTIYPEEKPYIWDVLDSREDMMKKERGTFIYIDHPWYAEAYGGREVERINEQITEAEELRQINYRYPDNVAQTDNPDLDGNILHPRALGKCLVVGTKPSKKLWYIETNYEFTDGDDEKKIQEFKNMYKRLSQMFPHLMDEEED